MSFRKILCPIDFSSGSDHALRLAVRLASASKAELLITHAWYVPELAFASGDWTLSAEIVQRLVDDDEAGLAAAVTEASQLGAERVSSRLLNGAPGDQIVKAVQDDPAIDLVVVGTHGRTGLKRVLLGSVAEHVLRHAPCSVLAARERLEDTPFRNVLCPIDFSESSRHAVDLAAELCQPGGAGITLLNAIEVPTSYSKQPLVTDLLSELDRRTTHLLDQWAAALRAKVSVPVTARSRLGRAGGQVLAAIDEATFDLVVTGSHSRTGIRRALLGSVAEKVARHAWCPVLVARTRES